MKKVIKNGLTNLFPKQFEVAVIALYLLGGAKRSVDTEDAAFECHQLAPSLFSWQKYKDQINLELVRVSLSDAKKQRNGALVSGSGREGWRLSPRGMDWIAGSGHKLIPIGQKELKRGQSKAGSIDTVRCQRERNRLLETEGWKDWSMNGTISARAAREIFRVNEYTSDKMREIKVARLRAIFEKHHELSRFIKEAGRVVLKGD